MKEYHIPVKMISGGRITIPEEVREKLGLKDGDSVDITIAAEEKDKAVDQTA